MRQLEEYDDALIRQAKEAKTEKLKMWAEIKAKSPELAEFLIAVKANFGEFNLEYVKFSKHPHG